MKVNALSINALSDNLNFQMFAKLALKMTIRLTLGFRLESVGYQ